MDNINDLLKDYSNRHGLGESLPAARIVEIANKTSGGKYQAISFRNGKLKVEVESGPALYFLRQQEQSILNAINRELGSKKIKKILFHCSSK